MTDIELVELAIRRAATKSKTSKLPFTIENVLLLVADEIAIIKDRHYQYSSSDYYDTPPGI